MSAEEEQGLNSTQLLERKVEQLQKSLQSKILAYNNLESSYKETRENEESLLNHTTETEQMLYELTGKCKGFQDEILQLNSKVNLLEDENSKLKDELLEHKNVPEVSVLRDTMGTGPPKSNDSDDGDGSKQMKQIRALLNENKTLKTNMYWLTKELKTAKNKDEMTRRLRLDSGGLEEGRGRPRSSGDNDNNDICKCMKSIVSYVRKLERTVSTLKTVLDKNNLIINDLLLKKYGHIPKVVRSNDALGTCKLTESYVTINGAEEAGASSTTHDCIWDSQDEEGETESVSVIVPLEQTSSEEEYDDFEEDDEEDEYLNLSMNRDVESTLVHCRKHKPAAVLTTDVHTGFDPGIGNVSESKVPAVETEETRPAPRRTVSDPIVVSNRTATAESEEADPLQIHSEKDQTQQQQQQQQQQPQQQSQQQPEEQDPLNVSYGDGMLKTRTCPGNLPLALIQNLEMQRTQTYLTSKKSSEKSPFGNKELSKGTAPRSPAESPVGSPSHHGANRNVAELFERKGSTRKGYPMEINT